MVSDSMKVVNASWLLLVLTVMLLPCPLQGAMNASQCYLGWTRDKLFGKKLVIIGDSQGGRLMMEALRIGGLLSGELTADAHLSLLLEDPPMAE